jgi:hypothetical protein
MFACICCAALCQSLLSGTVSYFKFLQLHNFSETIKNFMVVEIQRRDSFSSLYSFEEEFVGQDSEFTSTLASFSIAPPTYPTSPPSVLEADSPPLLPLDFLLPLSSKTRRFSWASSRPQGNLLSAFDRYPSVRRKSVL